MPKVSRYLYIAVLIVAGEMVFGLPFHTARFFRPTLLEVFGFTNTQLGDLFAVYGITAMISYFPGGALADRFPARGLLTASLTTTAVGGVAMATIPGAAGMGFDLRDRGRIEGNLEQVPAVAGGHDAIESHPFYHFFGFGHGVESGVGLDTVEDVSPLVYHDQLNGSRADIDTCKTSAHRNCSTKASTRVCNWPTSSML